MNLREQFEQETEYGESERMILRGTYYSAYSYWLEARLLKAEEDKKQAAWEAWEKCWEIIENATGYSMNEDLHEYEFEKWWSTRKEENK